MKSRLEHRENEDAQNKQKSDQILTKGTLKIFIEIPNNSSANSIIKSASEKRIENSFGFDINKFSITFDQTCTIGELESAAVSPHFNVGAHSQLLSNVCSLLLPCHENHVDTVQCVHSSGDAALESEEKAILHGNQVAPIPASNKRIPCTARECKKSFSTRGNMVIHHQSVHQKLRPYECPTCPSKCPSLNALKVHMTSHSNERPYRCVPCNLSFKTHANLCRHQSQHKEGEQLNFKCDHCGGLFATECSLKHHKGKAQHHS